MVVWGGVEAGLGGEGGGVLGGNQKERKLLENKQVMGNDLHLCTASSKQ